MKKIFSLLLISVLTLLLIPNVYAKDEVFIESINLVKNSEKTTEISKPSVNGLKIGFDLSFSDLEDYAKYEVVVNNNSNKEYEIKDETKFSTSNYIEYKYEFKEKTNRVKANSKVTLYITITYKNPVPRDKLKDGKYIENNEMAISLSNEDNPKTFNNLIYLLFILISLIVISVLIKNKKLKSLSIIVIALLLVPTTIFALEKLKLDVATKITIEKKYKASFITSELIKVSDAENYKILTVDRKRQVQFNTTVNSILRESRIYINDEEYRYYPVIKEEGLYKAGATVNVKNYKVQKLTNESTCTLEPTPDYDEQPYDKLICQEANLEKIDTNYGEYNKKFNDYIQKTDLQIMNFTDVIDSHLWDSNQTVTFNTPNTFTMPEHDVVIQLEKSAGTVSH